MAIMKRVASRHHFHVLLHEKPSKVVNGSGKHCNWSLGTDKGFNLFFRERTERTICFICFVANTLMAVYKFNGLLKASIASATNAHRLVPNEAPPAIISSFPRFTDQRGALSKSENSSIEDAIVMDGKKGLRLGFGQIPELLRQHRRRNRTSPFAFTGNRFEFRAQAHRKTAVLPCWYFNPP